MLGRRWHVSGYVDRHVQKGTLASDSVFSLHTPSIPKNMQVRLGNLDAESVLQTGFLVLLAPRERSKVYFLRR